MPTYVDPRYSVAEPVALFPRELGEAEKKLILYTDFGARSDAMLVMVYGNPEIVWLGGAGFRLAVRTPNTTDNMLVFRARARECYIAVKVRPTALHPGVSNYSHILYSFRDPSNFRAATLHWRADVDRTYIYLVKKAEGTWSSLSLIHI